MRRPGLTPGHSVAPHTFVALADVDPTIGQDLRYAGPDNFVGTPLDGYERATCLLTAPAARALGHAQGLLAPLGYALLVLDGYRPQRAADHMLRWAAGPECPATRRRHHPRVPKDRLFGHEHLHPRSGHGRGSTVDVTLVDRRGDALDMGTPFDHFDPRSHAASTEIEPEARVNRQLLDTAMSRAGFRGLATAWWHYTLLEEPFADTHFDFPTTRTALLPPH
ncbi:M15 family metallopeptidase [Streptomyces sp. BI20]|uniref:M15 family metallopeptidase n=1 Tax=Streptomyces sp. BI20 TaxID=3403460 RepID=UPI003C721DB1